MFVDVEKLEGIIDRLKDYRKRLDNIFTNQNNNFSLLEDDEIWDGTTSDNAVIKYKEVKASYEGIMDSLDNQINFLISVKDKYSAANQKILEGSNNL